MASALAAALVASVVVTVAAGGCVDDTAAGPSAVQERSDGSTDAGLDPSQSEETNAEAPVGSGPAFTNETAQLSFTRLRFACLPEIVYPWCVPGPVDGTNCVHVRAQPIEHVEIRLTWASQNPTTDRLEVFVFTDRIVAMQAGTTGLTLEVDLRDQASGGADVQVDLDDLGRAEELPIEVELRVRGGGGTPPEVHPPTLCTHSANV